MDDKVELKCFFSVVFLLLLTSVLILVSISVFSVGVVYADSEDSSMSDVERRYYNAEKIVSDVVIQAFADVIKEDSVSVDYIEAELFSFPFDDSSQNILYSDLGGGRFKDSSILYRWEYLPDSVDITASFSVESFFDFPKISDRFPFPLESITGFEEYLRSSEIIDSDNKNIRSLAYQLASGIDDVYEVVFNIGRWVEDNIEYVKVPETEFGTKSASWVLCL